MSDWYARKLSELRGQPLVPGPPASAPQYPPTQPLAPGQLPPHLAPYAQPSQYVRQAPQPGQDPASQPPSQQPQYTSYDANTGAQVADDGTIALIAGAAQTGGSRVVQQNSDSCPNCGGGNYFTVQEGGVFSKSTGSRVHAMQCADCNYPQVQAGSHGGALQGSRSAGPARAARQLPPGHRVTVIADGGQQVTFEPPTGR